jgi:hypothetical protein
MKERQGVEVPNLAMMWLDYEIHADFGFNMAQTAVEAVVEKVVLNGFSGIVGRGLGRVGPAGTG